MSHTQRSLSYTEITKTKITQDTRTSFIDQQCLLTYFSDFHKE